MTNAASHCLSWTPWPFEYAARCVVVVSAAFVNRFFPEQQTQCHCQPAECVQTSMAVLLSGSYRRRLSLSPLRSPMAMLRPCSARGCFPSSRPFRAAPAAARTASSGDAPAACAVAAGRFRFGTSTPSSSAMASKATARPAKLSTPCRAASRASIRGVTSYRCRRVNI